MPYNTATGVSTSNILQTVFYTLLALMAFAANSVLCRLALEMRVDGAAIDAGSFTVVRLVSGISALLLILWVRSLMEKTTGKALSENAVKSNGSWFAAIMLFLYAAGFSYAYISLETGTGALILFGVVQMTMIAMSIYNGNKLHYTEWTGVALAFIGFVYLILPGVSAPSMQGLILMTIAGVAWGYYTLAGKKTQDPLRDTSFNFLRTIPFIIALAFYNYDGYYFSVKGLMLAAASGALTSGVGYTIWYIALRSLKTMQAAVLQLLVPVIAALGGILFVDEPLTNRLFVSAILILGGILLVVVGKKILVSKRP
ncbi:MAG: drug/metabolite transporter (DMT)-like permease [Oceanospirillaceae bacterium]|jgi:drug/metabolite transporter (DMT)-like permease